MQIFNYRFQPKLIPTLATLLLLPLLINLGMWQANKADKKHFVRVSPTQDGHQSCV
jgi:surfeit locus 1 family protein